MTTNKIKKFLISNSIYSLEQLSKLSGSLISTLKGYSEVKNEIPALIKYNQLNSRRDKQDKITLEEKKLIKYEEYNRKEVHDILDCNTPYSQGSGNWDISTIINVKEKKGDHVFFVTLGQSQSGHLFQENISSSGVLAWQSQPSMNLGSPIIKRLISHNIKNNNIYLFLRTSKDMKYTYLGLLGYLSHDRDKQHPVHFKWQIRNWKITDEVLNKMKLKISSDHESTSEEIKNKKSTLDINSVDNKNKILKTTIGELDKIFPFSVRLYNILIFHSYGENYELNKLIRIENRKILKLQNMGRKSFEELNGILKNFGLKTGMSEYDMQVWQQKQGLHSEKLEVNVLKTSIDDLNKAGIFPRELGNILLKHFFTIKELVIKTENEFLKLNGCGASKLNELLTILKTYNLHLGMSQRNIENWASHSFNVDKMLEAINKRQKPSQSPIDKFIIPIELQSLPVLSLLSIANNFNAKERASFVRLSNTIPNLGFLNNKSESELLLIKNFGRNTLSLIKKYFMTFYTGTFTQLAELFSSSSDYEIKHNAIHCSFFLRSFLNQKNIFIIGDIAKLDNIDFDEFNPLSRLCLLELRTIHLEGEKICTNSTVYSKSISEHLIKSVDDFLNNSCTDNEKKIIELRWDHSVKSADVNIQKSMGEIATKLDVSRERIRQILKKLVNRYKILYIFNVHNFYHFFYQKIINKLSPLELSDLSKKKNFIHNENLYIGLLAYVFNEVPFNGYLPRRYKNIPIDIYNKSKKPFDLDLMELLNTLILSEKFEVLEHLFIKEVNISREDEVTIIGSKYRLDNYDNKIYVNHLRYSNTKLISYILGQSEKPLKLSEIARIINASAFCDKVYSLKNSGRNSLLRIIERSPDSFQIDQYTFCHEKHLNYQREDWPRIHLACNEIIKNIGHQVSASYVYKNIKNRFPRFSSKYELVNIMKHNEDIVDLGFFNFTLSEYGQTERLLIKDIVSDILKKNPGPCHYRYLFEEASKQRTLRSEGFSMMATQWGFRKYVGGFIGLPGSVDKDLNYLLNDSDYLIKFVAESSEHNFSYISEYFNCDDLSLIEQNFSLCDDLIILQDNNSDDKFVINTNWTLRRKVKNILKNNSEPLNIAEIKWDLEDKHTNKEIQKILISKNYLYFKKVGQKFTYVDINYDSEELTELMEQIEEYLKSMDKNINLDELYDMAKDLTADIKSKNHLINLMNKNDNIFLVDNMVGLLS
jgi:DNA-directed RNA polymerase alpha subunit